MAFPLFEIPLNPEQFGNYPILQFGLVAIGFLVAVAGLLGWKRGEKIGRDAAATQTVPSGAPVAELHFDGPIRGIFDALGDIKARQLLARLEIKDDLALLLSGSRNAIIDKLAAMQVELREVVERCMRDSNSATENRVRDLTTNINAVHERLDDVMKTLAQIEDRMPRKR